MKSTLQALCLGLMLTIPAAHAADVHDALPANLDPARHYLFYLHGQIIEEAGRRPTHPRWGVYEYDQGLAALAERGFTVISEARASGTRVDAYAEKVAGQVRTLRSAGVPAEHIAVVGFSKGGIIAALASTRLDDEPGVSFGILAGCSDWLFGHFEIELHGRVLSLYDRSDPVAGSCARALEAMGDDASRREIALEVGDGHGTFYRPRKAWLEPLVDWLRPPPAAP